MSDQDVNAQEGPHPSQSTTIKATMPSSDFHPDVQSMQSVTLKDGPRVRKIAKYGIFRSRHTGEAHHDALTIKTFKKSKGQCLLDTEHSVSLSGENGDEIQMLLDLLNAGRQKLIPQASGTYVVSHARGEAEANALRQLIESVSASGEYDLFAQTVVKAGSDARMFSKLLERAALDPRLFAEAAAALNLAVYRSAVDTLRMLVESDMSPTEHQFQHLLAEHPWMFGSEYSELLTRRRWTRDEQQDFVVRRTSDGYIEIIEIKTPLNGKPLFKFDPSHKTYYADGDLSKVIGQVQNYIERIDADHDSIQVKDGEDTSKIRAKIIIGRDVNAENVQSLRRFNGHLHRIEVITFDGLLNTAERVLSYLESAMHPSAEAAA